MTVSAEKRHSEGRSGFFGLDRYRLLQASLLSLRAGPAPTCSC